MEHNKTLRIWGGFLLLLLLTIVFLIWNLFAGSVRLSASEILEILRGGAEGSQRSILLQIRLPRLVAALILGGALSVSGYLLQTFFHNPIASPFVLGISSGAKLTIAVTMIALLSRGHTASSAALIAVAFLGAMVSMGFVLAVSQKVRHMSMLVVCGVMIGYICSAATDLLVTFADDSNIVNLHNWSMGSFSGMSWENVRTMALVCGAALVLSFFLSKPIRAYQLGEVYAQNMGVALKAFRTALILLSSILSACVTAFAGPISFVGIAVPHLMKSLFHSAEPLLLIPAATRACAGLAVMHLRPMGTSQYAAMRRGGADLTAALWIFLALAVGLPIWLAGSFAPLAAAVGYGLAAWYGFRQLDGMSGDISGFALTVGELVGAATLLYVG